mmetsp:Transcript_45112/g.106892  ORF Transcript_45112/g.106892 Transcript_45112/m.106892 type:complete len:162 (-) Transcript_45112:41-526(-)|eukprot:1966229-Rhodomonas_salina.1
MVLRSWSGVASCAMAAAALLLFTAVTFHTRDANTRAVLMRYQSLSVPPAPKLSYDGPLYSGGGKWMLHGKTIERNIVKAESVASKQHHMAKKVVAAHKAVHKPSGWEKAAPGLAADVRTAAELVRSGSKHFRDINNGFEKAFDVHDAKVQMKRPVKMLTHV